MSWRHAETTKNAKAAKAAKPFFFAVFARFAFNVVFGSVRDSGHLPRIERREELACPFQIELRIGRLDAEEEPVPARQREARHVEHWVIRLRQSVEREHAEYGGECRDENRAFEGHRNERGP